MSNTLTLDDIRAAAEAKYGSLDIELGGGRAVSLLNPLRLPKAKRNKLVEVQEQLQAAQEDGADVDQEEAMREMVCLVARTEAQGKALLAAIGDDLAMLAEVLEGYSKRTQAGEA